MSSIYIEGVTSWRQAGGLHNGKTMEGSDEFLTYYSDIEAELALYSEEQFRGKHVWCPCDSPTSNFTRYFIDNFERLGLRKLTSTCLNGQRLDYDGQTETITTLDNGDMFSTCVEDLWANADVVVTNPPFSRKFEFLAKLLGNNKQFLFLCFNVTAGSYDFQRAMLAGKLWIGQHNPIQFMRPDGTPRRTRVQTRWYTNLTLNKTTRPLPLTKPFDQETAQWVEGGWNGKPLLNVNKIKDIPRDYYAPIACPVGILTDLYDLSEWVVLGGVMRHMGILPPHTAENYRGHATVGGKSKFVRVVVQRQ